MKVGQEDYALNKGTFNTAGELGDAFYELLYSSPAGDVLHRQMQYNLAGYRVMYDTDQHDRCIGIHVESGPVISLPFFCNFTGKLFGGKMKIGSVNISGFADAGRKFTLTGSVYWQVLEPVRLEGILCVDRLDL